MTAKQQINPIGPTGETIALCLSTATIEQLYTAAAQIQTEYLRRIAAGNRPEHGISVSPVVIGS